MRNQNLVVLEGHLVRDPEYKKSSNGNPILRFSIATNGYGTAKQNNGRREFVSYFDIIAWSELAESFSDKLKKGLGIRVVGPLSQWRWKDDDGKGHSRVNIIAHNIDFLFSKKKPVNF